MWDKYTTQYYLAIKKMSFATCNNMDRPRRYYAKRNKSDKIKYYMISLRYVI